MNKSNLNTLLYYADKNGMDKLYAEFKAGLKNYMRDSSKKYSEDEKVIYYFKEIHEDGIVGPVGITEESFPHSFDQYVYRKIQTALNVYRRWLNDLFEIEASEKTLALIKEHRSRITMQLNVVDNKITPPRKALKIILNRMIEIESRFNKTNQPDILQEFVDTFSRRSKFPSETIKTYLKVWERYQSFFNARSRVKKDLELKGISLPSSDTSLIYWEEKWSEYRDSRTAK